MTPLKAIRMKCLDCCCGSSYEVKMCTATNCPLYVYRDGHNPKLKGKGNADNFRRNAHTISDSENETTTKDKSLNEDISD